MISIPAGATPADVVGETEILAGQGGLNQARLIAFAEAMANGTFGWEAAQREEPLAFQQGSNGIVISQGHHRWVAARLAGVEIPVTIKVHRDFWPGLVPYAAEWQALKWE